eukprot:NODE_74_length_3479_cov_9.548105_g66_i0.p4 GENE.NODE_74_length_3479_cov_9.548105_g66_i0~~NODE_74_length_3479_cov_9.548105_g66_i0.p4  ORF type:complete len:170 (-),score=8.77 NODE_74_length_3479_cov_9.548105_g66_i0:1172-1681(-)
MISTQDLTLSASQSTLAGKKPVRTVAERKVGESSSSTTAVKRSTDGEAKNSKIPELSKIRNAMLYTRYKWATDESFRNRFSQFHDIIESTVSPNLKGDPTEKLLARGSEAWKAFSKDIKDSLKAEFDDWKIEGHREIIRAEQPLQIDENDMGNAKDMGNANDNGEESEI